MEIIAALVAVVSPALITHITEFVKQARTVEFSPYRKKILRAFVALMALGSAIGTALLTDQPLDQEALTVGVQAILGFIAATGLHFWNKYRTAQEEGRIAN